jgi:hypothetical protein
MGGWHAGGVRDDGQEQSWRTGLQLRYALKAIWKKSTHLVITLCASIDCIVPAVLVTQYV